MPAPVNTCRTGSLWRSYSALTTGNLGLVAGHVVSCCLRCAGAGILAVRFGVTIACISDTPLTKQNEVVDGQHQQKGGWEK